jgi:histidinol phosphatase-like enzyme/mannose-6-phosphate isomerase-like protein (cupin superfamily)
MDLISELIGLSGFNREGFSMNKVRAAFFDVDGIIRHNNTSKENGDYYCLRYEDVDYVNGIFLAHRYLQDAGYKIFWVTMQNCIKEGLISDNHVGDILISMIGDFSKVGIEIEDYRICQSPEETDESKVASKVEAITGFGNIDLSRSIGIGDRKHDIDAYKLAGIGATIQALNLYGDKKCDADYVYSNNPHISNLDGLFNILMTHHGCNDVQHLIRIAGNFHHVEKIWGDEYWIVNDKLYCSKILILRPNHISSLHYHIKKCETFTVLAGIVHIEHNNKMTLTNEAMIYIKGESVLIPSGINHRFMAIKSPAVILETSTYHKDEDTYRLEESK